MKKLLAALVFISVILLIAYFAFSLFIEKTLIAGVETIGPRLTGTTVELNDVDLSLIAGRIEISGLEVGNPDGFKSDFSIKLGRMTLDVVPFSLIGDKVIIEEIVINGPELIYETSFRGANISKILKNVEGVSSSAEDDSVNDDSEGKRFEIRKLVISNGKVKVANKQLGGEGLVVPLVDFTITDIGTNERGATMANVVRRVMLSINTQTIASATKSGKFVGKQFEGTVDNVKGAVGGLLKSLKKKPKSESE